MAQRRSATRPGSGGLESEAVRVWLLGDFRACVGARTIEASGWRLRKAAGLVKLLALAPGHRLHREQVMDVLWPDLDTKSAANNLHRALHFARGALEPGAENDTSRYLSLARGVGGRTSDANGGGHRIRSLRREASTAHISITQATVG